MRGERRLDRDVLRLSLVIFTAAILPFVSSLRCGLLYWDDVAYITWNRDIQQISISHLAGIFSRSYVGNYAPLHLLSYMVDYAIWGLNPLGYHLMNSVLHGVNAVLVYLLVRRVLGREEPAVWASLFFAVHPLQVETVVWITERKALLAAFFFFFSFLSFIRFSDSPGKKHLYLSLVFFILSCLSKVSAIAAPLVYGMYLYFSRGENLRTLVKRILPFAVVSAIFSAIAVGTQASPHGFELHGDSLLSNLYTTIVAVAQYGKILLFPVQLSAYYWFSYHRLTDPVVMVSLALTAAALFGLWRYAARRRAGAFWAVWPFLLFIPNLQIIPLAIVMADRYWYLPLVGPAVLFGLLSSGAGDGGRGGRRRLRTALSASVLLVMTALTLARVPVWKSDLALWRDALSKTRTPVAYSLLAMALTREGDSNTAVAEKYHRAAVALAPKYWLPLLELARIASRRGDRAEAEAFLYKLFSLSPALKADDEFSIAEIYTKIDRRAESIAHYKAALEQEPDKIEALNNLALLYAEGRDESEREQAIILAARAVHIDPRNVAAKGTAAWANLQGGRNERAKALYHDLVSEFPDSVVYLNNLAMAYSLDRDPLERRKGIEYAERAAHLSSMNPDVLDTLVWAYFKAGMISEARSALSRGLRVPGGDPLRWLHAAQIEEAAGDMISARRYLNKYPALTSDHAADPRAEELRKRLFRKR